MAGAPLKFDGHVVAAAINGLILDEPLARSPDTLEGDHGKRREPADALVCLQQ